MKTYKYETHFHTRETSPCGKVNAADGLNIYHRAGYAGVIITDHYFEGLFKLMPAGSWKNKIDAFLKGYRAACDEGQKLGLDIILGMELRFTENGNDYLIYGFDETFLIENKELYLLNLREFRELTRDTGIIIVQAHPFRPNIIAASPELIDGVEIHNGNPRQNSNNDLAEEYAVKNGLKMISGSDFHQPQDAARGGIIVEHRIISPEGFVETIMQDKILEFIRAD